MDTATRDTLYTVKHVLFKGHCDEGDTLYTVKPVFKGHCDEGTPSIQ